MDMDIYSWFAWDFGTTMLFTILGVFVWAICQNEELKDKVKHPKWIGSAFALVSGIELGLLAIVPFAFFLLITWCIEYYTVKYGVPENNEETR